MLGFFEKYLEAILHTEKQLESKNLNVGISMQEENRLRKLQEEIERVRKIIEDKTFE